MKRVLAFVLALLLICSTLVFAFGCDKQDAQTDEASNEQQNQAADASGNTQQDTQSNDQQSSLHEVVLNQNGSYIEYGYGDWKYRYVGEKDGVRNIGLLGYTGQAKDLTVPATINGNRVTAVISFKDNGVEILRLPDSVVILEINCCARNQSLKELYCGNGLQRIGQQAFNDCSALEKVVFSSQLTGIGSGAFLNCKLQTITIPAGASIGLDAFANNTTLTSITFEDGVTTITESFTNCCNIQTLTIPASVTQINGSPFYHPQSRLTSVRFLGNAPTFSNGAEPFGPANPDITIYYPANATGWNTTALGELYTLTPYQPE